MVQTKRIKSLKVVKAGSSPDIDSDFNTAHRADALQHVKDIYGADNVSSIGTFGTLLAKGAFKTMCTIYEIPFAQANKISDLIPDKVDGEDVTFAKMFDPTSPVYGATADFRAAISASNWEPIIKGAIGIEGKNKSTGAHACGYVISSKPLFETVPLLVRQKDGEVISQWTYPELESLGLIKMDFLGLDTVDLIQHTVENIMKNGKTPPNMMDIVHGPMDDPKTFALLQRGETIGTFQLASDGMQELLKRIKPTTIDDIIAATALYRPGPMGMNSHTRYADRKNGREKIDYVHPDFNGSELEDILKDTYSLVVYQEQIIRIANQIAGMTLQEGDDLRSAMGKKKIEKMAAMKPKFIDGGRAKGYSEEAMIVLWDTCAEFAKYGFNLSHSVAYGINAYQTAYLKANYPVEFMAALIAQNVNKRDKLLTFLQEARRMGLKVGSIDVNSSDIAVSPDYENSSEFDIVFGFAGASSISEENARIIVEERQKGGKFTSVQDMVNRCYSAGVQNSKIFENIAKAGGFDSFGVSRRAVVESVRDLIGMAKTKVSKGASLFDLMGASNAVESATVDLSSMPEYPYVEMLKHEASVVGLYLTSHPLSKAGPGLSKARTSTISSLLKSSRQTSATITVAVTEVEKKIMARGGRRIAVTLDDGTSYMRANISKTLVKMMDKGIAQDRVRKLYEDGQSSVPPEMEETVLNPEFAALSEVEKNSVYVMSVTFRPPRGEDQPYSAVVNSIEPLVLADNGTLPIRMRLLYNDNNKAKATQLARKLPQAIAKRNPGDYPIFLAYDHRNNLFKVSEEALYAAAIDEIRNGANNRTTSENPAKKSSGSNNLWGGAQPSAPAKGKKGSSNENARSWPPRIPQSVAQGNVEFSNTTELIKNATYVDTGFRAAKGKATELDIEKYLGVENYDFGVWDPSIIDE